MLSMLLTLAALWLLAGLLARHIQALVLLLTRSGTAASAGYDLVVLPGVVLHEIAHIVAAFLLRVRVVRADLFRFRRPGDSRQGEVIVERADPLRMSVIGAAPLLLGVPALLFILRSLELPPLGLSIAAVQALRPLLDQPSSLLRLYLLWAIANTMFPSAADRAAWWVVGAAAATVVVVAILTGYSLELPPRLLDALLTGAARLTAGLLPVVVLDLALLVLITALVWLAECATGRRVVRSR